MPVHIVFVGFEAFLYLLLHVSARVLCIPSLSPLSVSHTLARTHSEHLFSPLLPSQAEANNSLKTLMELYDDARLRDPDDGTGRPLLRSPNELDFRCYFILTYAGDKEDKKAMLMVQHMTPEELATQPIRLAVNVYKAILTGNWVQFFNLFAGATLLQACAMHLHVHRMRMHALSVLEKTCKLPKKDSAAVLPLSELTDMLRFPSEAKARQYLGELWIKVCVCVCV